MTKLLYQRILVVLLALIVVFGGWFAADWQLRRAEAAANWTDQKQVLILDAGHGGEDGGAVAPNGTVGGRYEPADRAARPRHRGADRH